MRALFLEVGVGLIAGCVIAVTIEDYMRNLKLKEDREEEEKIRRNVFEALFQTAVHPGVVDEMYKAIIVPKFMRKGLEIRFRFRRLSPTDDLADPHVHLVMQQTVTFKAVNLTGLKAKHTVIPREYVLIEDANFAMPFKSFRMRSDCLTINLATRKELEEQKNQDEESPWHSLKPQSVPVPRGGTVDVCSVIEKICRVPDTKTWITKYAADRLKLIVEICDEDIYNLLEFAVDQSHRVELTKCDSSLVESQMTYTWILDAPILPNQAIILHWRRRPTSGESSEGAKTRDKK